MPNTCRILQHKQIIGKLKQIDHKGVPGKVAFTRLLPTSQIMEHTGGHNMRLTCHLGLVIPEGSSISVAGERRRWEAGKVMVIDDSFVHSVVNDHPTESRYILLFHIWHPDVTRQLGYETAKASRLTGKKKK